MPRIRKDKMARSYAEPFWKIGLYIRLSREDDNEDESESVINWKSHATLTLLANQDLPTFGYNMIDPLKPWCWGSILFYPFKISRFS